MAATVTGGPPPVGSAAEEAARLLAAAEQWLRERTGAPSSSDRPHGAECAVCPLCQGIAAVRSVRPETVEHLLDATASLVAALRSTVGAGPERAPGPRPGVQRITVQPTTDDEPGEGE